MTDLATLGIRVESQEVGVADARMDAAAASAQRLEAATDDLASSARFGSSAFATMNAAIRQQDQLQRVAARSAGLTAQETLNLGRQLGDVGVSLASGMPLWMVAIQQGDQIRGTFAEAATRGVGFRQALVGLAGSMGPVTAGLGLAGGAAAALVGLWSSGENSALSYERVVTGLGRTAGMTARELEDLTEESARLGEVSIASARDQAAAYLATGRIGSQVLDDLIRIGRDYASFMGLDATDATKSLAQAMLDPEKAARDMTRSFGLLTQAQIAQIDAAMKAGDQARAQAIIIGELDKAVQDHAETVGEIDSIWQALGRTISDVITKMGQALYTTRDERLQQIIDRRASIERGQRENGRPLDARTQGIYDTLGREGMEILRERQREADRLASQQARATANQAAQIGIDNAPRPSGRSDATRQYDSLIEGARDYVRALEEERSMLGMTSIERERAESYRRADEVATQGQTAASAALAAQIRQEADALATARTEQERLDATRKGTESLQGMLTQLERQAELMGQSSEAQALMNAEWAIANLNLKEITPEMQALIDKIKELAQSNEFAAKSQDQLTTSLRIARDYSMDLADQIDRATRTASQGFGDAFGKGGAAIGDMLTSMTGLNAEMERIANAEQKYREAVGDNIDPRKLGLFEKERADITVAAYGDMLSAARGYFDEGSAGYRALLVVEQAYRAYQLVSAIQGMALSGQETALTVAQNGIKAASHGVVAVARAIASMPFPLNLAAGAATIAALAAIGVKIAGGGSDGGATSAANDNSSETSTDAVRSYAEQQAQAQEQATAAMAQAVRVQIELNDPMFTARVQKEAAGVAAPMAATAAAGAKADVMRTLERNQQTNRRVKG